MPWQACAEGRRHAARGWVRKRAAGAGARHQLVFVDRLVATLIYLRRDLLVCQKSGATGIVEGYWRAAERRPSKVMSKAFRAVFQGMVQRAWPLPAGSRDMIAM